MASVPIEGLIEENEREHRQWSQYSYNSDHGQALLWSFIYLVNLSEADFVSKKNKWLKKIK